VELLARFGVQPSRQLVEDVEAAVVPAALVTRRREDLVEGCPEPEGAVADRHEGRLGEAAVTQLAEHLGPRGGALAVALLHREQLLAPVGGDAEDNEHRSLLLLQPGLEIQAIGEEVDVALGDRRAAPEAVLVRPRLLEAQDARRGERRRLADQRPEDRLEVARGQALEVQPRQQAGLGARTALVAAHDLRAEGLGTLGDVADSRLANLDGTHAGPDRPGGQVAVAVAAELLGTLVAEPAEELIDLRGERLLEEALGSLTDELLDGVIGRRNGGGRGRDLVPCRQRRGLQDRPGLRADGW
jgi:hypothetical protein